MTPLPIHLTRSSTGYWAASPEVHGVGCGSPTRDETVAYARVVFRPWAGERGVEIVDLTGDEA